MCAFVSSYDFDIFVSYASVDNVELIAGDDASKWVSELKRVLQRNVDDRLGRSGSARIWMDKSHLDGHSDFSEEILAAVRSAAVLVCVASEAYLVSEWCRREREEFLDASGGDLAGRLFVVRRDDISETDPRWPEPFRARLGYKFFSKNEETERVTPLAYPKPDSEHEKIYYERLYCLGDDIAESLKHMTAPPVPPGGKRGDRKLPAIYLGEVTPDLHEERENLKRHLRQCDYEVVPADRHSRDPAEFRKSAERDLREACLFVQLLGPTCSPASAGLPEGYGGAELEIATNLGKPVLAWRSRELERGEVEDTDHQERVFGPEVVAMTIEEFKGHLDQKIAAVHAQNLIPNGGSQGDNYVLLRSHPTDAELADSIAEILNERDIGYAIVDNDNHISLKALTKEEEFNGLMVLYGNSSRDWVGEQVRECRKLALDLKERAPECAVYIGPPEPKAPLKRRPPRFLVCGESRTDLFEEYLSSLSRGSDQA